MPVSQHFSSPLVQACNLAGTKLLREPMMIYCQSKSKDSHDSVAHNLLPQGHGQNIGYLVKKWASPITVKIQSKTSTVWGIHGIFISSVHSDNEVHHHYHFNFYPTSMRSTMMTTRTAMMTTRTAMSASLLNISVFWFSWGFICSANQYKSFHYSLHSIYFILLLIWIVVGKYTTHLHFL